MSLGALAFLQLPGMKRSTAAAQASAMSAVMQWATNYKAPLPADPLTIALSPPVVSMGNVGDSSTISSGVSIANTSPLITKFGNWVQNADSVFINSERTGGRIRFNLFGPRVDVRVSRVSASTRGFSIAVDGQVLSKAPFDTVVSGFASKATGGNPNQNAARQYMQIDFGANAQTYSLVRASVGVAGTGYAVGDTITVTGGTSTTAAVLRVTGINFTTGAVTNVVVQTPGSYTAIPSSPLQQASTSGAGSGFQATSPLWSKNQSTSTKRQIEITFDYGTMFGGLVVGPTSVVTASNPVTSPKYVGAGDSITEYLMANFAAGTWSWQLARLIGLGERFVPYGTAGRGYMASTPFSLDIAGIIAEAPDFLTIALGTNDALNAVNVATLTATVTANLNTIRAALPNVKIVVIGPFAGDSAGTYTAAIQAGVLAANVQKWTSFVDFRALGVYSETSQWACVGNTSGTTDVHPTQAGHDVTAAALAPIVGALFRQMALTL